MTEQKIRNAANVFRNQILPLLSHKLHTEVETVCDAVGHNLVATVAGFQINDKFLWTSVLHIQDHLIPVLSDEFKNEWGIIYDFLYERIGRDVENHYQEMKRVTETVDNFRKKNNLKTKWGIAFNNENFLHTIYPQSSNFLIYNESSGWGNPSTVALTPNATYGDIWIAANSLYINSGDTMSKVIKSIQPTSDGLVVIFDIEN